MDEYESLSHSKWECKYHLVFIPKRHRQALYKQLRVRFFNRSRRPSRVE